MSAKLERDKAKLANICAAVAAAKSDTDELYAQRDALLRQLRADGVPRAELLALSGLGAAALKWALSGGRSARTAAKKAPVKRVKRKAVAKAKR